MAFGEREEAFDQTGQTRTGRTSRTHGIPVIGPFWKSPPLVVGGTETLSDGKCVITLSIFVNYFADTFTIWPIIIHSHPYLFSLIDQ